MKLSPLQIARYQYSPKLPGMLRNGIAEICVKEGAETSSVADQEKIKALFPNTYGKKEITFQKGENTSMAINLHFMTASKMLFYRWFPEGKAVEEVL